MRLSGPVFAGFFLALAGGLAFSTASAQSIQADPALNGYTPAPQALNDAPSDADVGAHGSGLPYFTGLRGSFAFRNDSVGQTPGSPTHAVVAHNDVGGGGSLYYGMRLPMGLRVEVEGLYRYQPLNSLTVDGLTKAGAHGSAQTAGPMVNFLWEMPVGDALPIKPFVGVGAGALYSYTNVNDGTNDYLKHNGWDLAVDFLAGASLPLSQSSRLTAMYRWMQVRDVTLGCATTGAVLGNCYKTNLTSQGIDLGLEMDL
jgi:opacity protein-like surface antigen